MSKFGAASLAGRPKLGVTASVRTSGTLRAVVAVGLLRALATALVLILGFSAISDDDFARIVIAQGFAADPHWDPSGTSWLPLPFWLYGAFMKLFGASVWVARGLSWVLSVGSAVLVFVAARWAGFGVRSSGVGAAFAAVLPHAVWLGAATVPEGFTAALCLGAIASTSSPDMAKRWAGAAFVLCASLSRYEAWAIAGLFFAACTFDAFRTRRFVLLGPALLSIVGPLGWMAHGALHHQDALFFIQRVADYRRALGRSPHDVIGAVTGYPKVLLRAEPELMVGALLALVTRRSTPWPPGTRRLLLAAFGLLGFLILGDLRDGAPTHHPERPLLMVWLVLCVVAGHAVLSLRDRKAWLLGALGLALVLFLFRPFFTRRDSFIDRSAELHIGDLASRHIDRGKLLIETKDYGFFAIMAGFRRVLQTEALTHRDPRVQQPDPWSTQETLLRRLHEANAGWAIVPIEKLPALAPLGAPREITERYALVRLQLPTERADLP